MKKMKRFYFIALLFCPLMFAGPLLAAQTVTVTDALDREVTLPQPIERFIVGEDKIIDFLKILDVDLNKIVGVEEGIPTRGCYPEISDRPIIGGAWKGFDLEKITQLKPDFVLMLGNAGATREILPELEKIGINVVCLNPFLGNLNKPLDVEELDLDNDKYVKSINILAAIFGREQRAEKYLQWRKEKIDLVMNRVSKIPADKRRSVYLELADQGKGLGDGRKEDITLDMAGLRNIVESYGRVKVSKEFLTKMNPEFVLFTTYGEGELVGYNVTDAKRPGNFLSKERKRPELKYGQAVSNGNFYLVGGLLLDMNPFIGALYLAKAAYPDLFEDVSPEKLHREYMEDWVKIKYQGIHFYPALAKP